MLLSRGLRHRLRDGPTVIFHTSLSYPYLQHVDAWPRLSGNQMSRITLTLTFTLALACLASAFMVPAKVPRMPATVRRFVPLPCTRAVAAPGCSPKLLPPSRLGPTVAPRARAGVRKHPRRPHAGGDSDRDLHMFRRRTCALFQVQAKLDSTPCGWVTVR